VVQAKGGKRVRCRRKKKKGKAASQPLGVVVEEGRLDLRRLGVLPFNRR